MTTKAAPPLYPHRHLLGIRELSPADIELLLDRADAAVAISRQPEKKTTTLRGRTQINLFFEASTRTQSSFELAGKRLGADVMNMSVATSSVKKGETLIDTAMTLNAMRPDILIIRHQSAGAVRCWPEGRLLGGQCRRRRARTPDAGAARRTHHPPRQRPHRAADGGDLRRHPAFSRVARSNITCSMPWARACGCCARRRCCPRASSAWASKSSPHMAEGAERRRRGDDVAPPARAHVRRLRALGARIFPLSTASTPRSSKAAKDDALVMHPGPMNRGVEIDSEIADDIPQSVIQEQVEMGVAVRMAVMEALLDPRRNEGRP
jgi:aspartate carbamoyltransferase catalytic subunit